MGPGMAALVFPCTHCTDIAGGKDDYITEREAVVTRPVEVGVLVEVEHSASIFAVAVGQAEAELGLHVERY